MKIVIIGDGKIGSTLSRLLLQEGHDITIIDNDKNTLNNAINIQDIMCVEGNGATYDVQVEAGVPDADLVIACTATDELNMLCCVMANKLGAKRTIARIRNPEYHKQMSYLKEELGLSMYVNPELATAIDISRVILFPPAMKIELFAKGRVELVEYKIPEDSQLCDLPVSSIYKLYNIKMLICAVQRDKQVFIPSGDFILHAGDKINITATHDNIEKFFSMINKFKKKSKYVMIVGGGMIGYYLASHLIQSGIRVKIIENNYERCVALSELLPKATIINGDGTDQALLTEEGIETADAFASLTGIDEENIIMALFATTINVPKVIAKVNRETYSDMAEHLHIDTIVSPKNITANLIDSYVRAKSNSYGSNIETLYRLVDGKLEALEFIVKDNGKYVGVPIKDLHLKKNVLIACIVRKRMPIIPDGNEAIQIGDSVIIVTSNQHFNSLEDILE